MKIEQTIQRNLKNVLEKEKQTKPMRCWWGKKNETQGQENSWWKQKWNKREASRTRTQKLKQWKRNQCSE